MYADGTIASGTFSTTEIAIGSLVVGNRYKVKTANSGGDATVVGCAASTAVVGEEFTALTDGTGVTGLVSYAEAVPTASTVAADILSLKQALDDAKAPRS